MKKPLSLVAIFFGALMAMVWLLPLNSDALMAIKRELPLISTQLPLKPTELPLNTPSTLPLMANTATRLPLKYSSPTPLPELIVQADVLHLRECAGLDCRVLDWLYAGERLTWYGECEDGWAHVQLHNGYVYAKYLATDVCEGR